MRTEDIRNRKWSKSEIEAIRRAAERQAAGEELPEAEYADIPRLNAGAHVGYKTMQIVYWLHEHEEQPFGIEAYTKHINSYIIRIDHLRGLLETGRDLDTAKQCIINMHTPIEEFARLAKEQSATNNTQEEGQAS